MGARPLTVSLATVARAVPAAGGVGALTAGVVVGRTGPTGTAPGSWLSSSEGCSLGEVVVLVADAVGSKVPPPPWIPTTTPSVRVSTRPWAKCSRGVPGRSIGRQRREKDRSSTATASETCQNPGRSRCLRSRSCPHGMPVGRAPWMSSLETRRPRRSETLISRTSKMFSGECSSRARHGENKPAMVQRDRNSLRQNPCLRLVDTAGWN